ncbi:mitochondrial cardiolipin hydrolase-like [Cimex lectularius]|uniref:Mitochondrial cardiolipin hydrolase n=1 Tax=Cimex lectularius TaxID=79782 RepID=A0A8I6RUJ9_CIMLE|nr:mitochondrial cardiolipin hydrolase-like [Cimex lectularius]
MQILQGRMLDILTVAIPIGVYTIYKLHSYKKTLRDIEAEVKRQKSIVNDALFFRASGVGDCEKHIYKKKLCFKSDCPYRKLRYIMDCLESCRQSLDVCIHLLTSMEIATCIINAQKRGVKVRVICDNEMSTNKGSQVRTISEAGVAVRIPLLNYHMHSKIAIIDKWKVMTGSVNWTVQGMYGNWDNLVVTSQKDIVKNAMDTFELIWNDPKTEMFC